MRTTLTIDDDVLAAAKEIARLEKHTVGQTLSDLAREGLQARQGGLGDGGPQNVGPLGFAYLPSRGGIVTSEDVERLRNELGV
jgi:hypothetical protein